MLQAATKDPSINEPPLLNSFKKTIHVISLLYQIYNINLI